MVPVIVEHGDLPALLVLVEEPGGVVTQVLQDERLVVAEEVAADKVAVGAAAYRSVEDERVVREAAKKPGCKVFAKYPDVKYICKNHE